MEQRNLEVRKTTKSELQEKAHDLAKLGKSWHFHILTPFCTLNTSDENAFIVEDNTDDEVYIHYSDEPQMALGKELIQMLHGKEVLKREDEKGSGLNPAVVKILKRAKGLNDEGKNWHHHMLFPACSFNQHKGKWTIIFEDQEGGEVLESTSDSEPKGDLKEIETLFYKQKSLD